MPKKQWVYSPKKPSKAQVPDAIKQEVMTKANALVETVLKPKNVNPPPENPQFNYLVDIFTKWYRSYFYFYAKYCCPSPNCITPFFDVGVARLEYIGPDHFNLSYTRYSDQWLEIATGLSLEACLAAIQQEPLFMP